MLRCRYRKSIDWRFGWRRMSEAKQQENTTIRLRQYVHVMSRSHGVSMLNIG